MKKFTKLLCFIFAVISMCGFITVKADSVPDNIIVNNDHDDFSIRPGYAFYTKSVMIDGQRRYAFCLDSFKHLADGMSHVKDDNIYSGQANIQVQINNIVSKAYSLGFANGEGVHTSVIGGKSYTISERDFYAVTQMAVWRAVHGDSSDNNGDGYVKAYQDWIGSSTNPERAAFFNTIWNARNDSSLVYSVKIVGNTSMVKDGDYLVSEDLMVQSSNVPDGISFEVSVSDISAGSAGIEKSGLGNWNSTQTVVNGDKIRVRMPILSDVQEYSVKINIVSKTFASGYNTFFYKTPISNGQNIAIVIPSVSNALSDVLVTGNYERKNLYVSKVDATNQEELDGAKMKVYGCENDNSSCSWVSEKGVKHQIKDLVIGKVYKLEEVSSPDGYDPLTVDIYFKLLDNGKTQLCSVKDNNIENAVCGDNALSGNYAEINDGVLVIKNYPSKKDSLIISKKDFTTGEEVKGAHLQIFRFVDGKKDASPIYDWVSDGNNYVISDIKPGKYVLIEVLPSPDYEEGMIINGNRVSEYQFEIVAGKDTMVEVYNELKPERIDVPITGFTTNTYIIGGLVVLFGVGIITFFRKNENI